MIFWKQKSCPPLTEIQGSQKYYIYIERYTGLYQYKWGKYTIFSVKIKSIIFVWENSRVYYNFTKIICYSIKNIITCYYIAQNWDFLLFRGWHEMLNELRWATDFPCLQTMGVWTPISASWNARIYYNWSNKNTTTSKNKL